MCCCYYPSIGVWLFLLFQGKFILGHRVDSTTEYRVATSLPGFGNLTQGYNKYLRPNFGGEPVTIGMSVNIASISSISESDMMFLQSQAQKCSLSPCSSTASDFPDSGGNLSSDGSASGSGGSSGVACNGGGSRGGEQKKKETRHLAVNSSIGRQGGNLSSDGSASGSGGSSGVACNGGGNRGGEWKKKEMRHLAVDRRQRRSQEGVRTLGAGATEPEGRSQCRTDVISTTDGITTTVACNMDLSKYPLDTQTCRLQLESWGYDENDVLFTWLRGNDSVRGLDNLRLSQYTVEHYYTFETRSQHETGNYPRLIVQFELKRNILYFVLETYVPSTLLVVLSWVSFWITLDSVPARTCIGVTTVLSMTTLMMGSRNSVTKTNGFIKAIDIYLGICFSFIFGALVEYAFAHYVTSQKGTANKPQMDSTNNVSRETGDITIVDILNTSVASYNRKLNFPTFDNDLTINSKGKIGFIIKNKMRKANNYFTIHNPSNIDHYSKLLFPLFFMVVNLLYWAYYLCF
ncbi:PREDICTED: gamma-aminobutyric acid receptor subunit pi [Gekko japonicus]|uniref:Gamma-aminobutyric acid receptor subunit pi n=1 Tax=Gekko japonicus TaxID=146911 RepID=A0ABM1K654_GEKJA|nr:PREDICTED: gamma-aminobutyric acid receptor subunit pi [Gekko japonicus]